MGLTLGQLIESYRTDQHSNFGKLHPEVRAKQERLFTKLIREHGSKELHKIRFRTLASWYTRWLEGNKIALARSLVDRMRESLRFGSTILEDSECVRLFESLSRLRLKTSPARTTQLTREQAKAVRDMAHYIGWHSLAFAQALQFELLLGQKDVIGEWVSRIDGEEATDAYIHFERKWRRGLRWSDIDDDLILRHRVGSSARSIQVDLRTAPMVMEELDRGVVTRTASGPMVICETNGLPWLATEFRRKWRIVARLAGVPDNVANRDSASAGMTSVGSDRAKVVQEHNLRRINYVLRAGRNRTL